jgi:hypothetical protein
VQDPAGLLLGGGREPPALEPAEHPSRRHRQVRVDEQAHPRGKDGVAAEQRHEPRRAGGHHRFVGWVDVEDAKGADVLDGALVDPLQALDVARQAGPALAPL